jgi:hypothetical protein
VQASADGVVETPLEVSYLGDGDALADHLAGGLGSAPATKERRTRRRVTLPGTAQALVRASGSAGSAAPLPASAR